MAVKSVQRGPSGGGAPASFINRPNANDVYVDGSTNVLVFGAAASGTTAKTAVDTTSTQTLTNKTLTGATVNPVQNTYVADGAITVASQTAYLTKGSAGAYTLAAPGAAGIGVRIVLTTGTDFAHVVTFTGTTLQDGTAGANTTWTAAAVQGSSLTVLGVTATKWNVESFNLGTIAP